MKIERSPLREEAGPEGSGGGGAAQPTGSSLAASPSTTTLSPEAGATPSSPPSWRDSLNVADEVRSSKVFENIKDPSDAITQLYHAQKDFGAEKLLKPQEGWTPEQYGEFYKSLGRPDDAGTYTYPALDEKHQGMFDKEMVDGFRETFFEAGLNQGQVDKIMGKFFESNIAKVEGFQAENAQKSEAALLELHSKYGDQFEGKMHTAQAAAQHYGVGEVLRELGVDKDPRLIEAFMQIGEAAMESSPQSGRPTMTVSNQAQALHSIEQFKMNPEKMQALHDPRQGPAKEAAQKEWLDLHKLAFPPEAQE